MGHRFLARFAAMLACASAAFAAGAQAPAVSRGALLYNTHCIECHNEQMHWRTFNRARDWDSLKDQVRHWQGRARLNWTEEDIRAVAGHLNDTIYQFPRPQARR